MIFKILFIVILSISLNKLNAQSDYGWIHVNPIPFSNDIIDISFIDENTGFALTSTMIFKTTDFGLSWSKYTELAYPNIPILPNHTKLRKIKFIDSKGFIGCQNGILLISLDYGKTFTIANTGPGTDVNDIYFLNTLTGFLGGFNSLKRTTNGGINWSNVNLPFGSITNKIEFTDESNGLIVSNGGNIFKTSNGGLNWQPFNVTLNKNIYGIDMINNSTGYICGDSGFISKTVNGGINWTTLNSSTNDNLNSINFINSNTGIAVSYQNDIFNFFDSKIKIYRTINGGSNWNLFNIYDSTDGKTTVRINQEKIMIGGSYGFISRSEQNGIFEKITKYNVRTKIWYVKFFNENTGILINDTSQLFHSTDGGSNWNYYSDLKIGDYNPLFIEFNNLNFGHGVFYNPNFDTEVFKTNNGGINWVLISPKQGNILHYKTKFLNENSGYVFSEEGMYKTTNAGMNWNIISDSAFLTNDVIIFNENNMIIHNFSQGILKTTNAGVNWIKILNNQLIEDPYIIDNFDFIDMNTGYVAFNSNEPMISFYNAKLLKTTNSGISWDSVSLGLQRYIFDIEFLGLNKISILTNNKFYTSTNNGVNFMSSYIDPYSVIKIQFINSNTGFLFALGIRNNILKTTTGGTVFINNETIEIPNIHTLHQNYPNPFNPTTTIRFNLSKPQFVTLKVYDIMGREVQTLVNDIKQSGEHRVEFNGGILSSGIYFYRIIINSENVNSGEYSDVKKMILLK